MRKRPDVGSRPARGSIRVSAGEWRGRRLEIPPGARPTSARAREALLDILQPRIAEAHVLDLYSGSGAVGLEAVSRGAARAVLVEQDAGVLERNVSRLAAGRERVEVLGLPAESALALLDRRGERFGIVFADPPYGSGLPEEVGRGVGRLLSPDGIFVLQADRGAKEPRLAGLGRVDRRDYGRNLFIFYGLSVGSF